MRLPRLESTLKWAVDNNYADANDACIEYADAVGCGVQIDSSPKYHFTAVFTDSPGAEGDQFFTRFGSCWRPMAGILFDALEDNIRAWQDEEDSVRAEHASLIADAERLVNRLRPLLRPQPAPTPSQSA